MEVTIAFLILAAEMPTICDFLRIKNVESDEMDFGYLDILYRIQTPSDGTVTKAATHYVRGERRF